MQTNDRQLVELMRELDSGAAQLPDFQRGWVWDDGRIRSLILSVIHSFPIGAAMFLKYGDESIHFKHKPIEGSPANLDKEPIELILDGQQRLTSLYNALYSRNPVHTRTDKGKDIERFYYLDIAKALDSKADDEEVVISVPASRQITSDFGRHVEKDLTTREQEFKLQMFPLNIILDTSEEQNWQNDYYAYHNYNPDVIKQFTQFFSKVINPVLQYQIPVISLDETTPKEAVCQVFENVNTGGVSLTVFELVTAIFAMDDFPLRKDWERRHDQYFSGDLLSKVTATDFLTALTLLSAFKAGGTVSCKKKDVLALTLDNYKKYADSLCSGFSIAEKLLKEERIFSSGDLPYSAQLIPFSAICTVLMEGNRIHTTSVKNMVKQWYWCGVFGELYGSANETRYANDIVQVTKWINDGGELPKTVTDFYFNPMRLLGLQSRQSAAYKGVMALILKNHARDFISGEEMDFSMFSNEKIDIHHIFPKDYCIKMGYEKRKWNSVVNKTPISASSNREIGGYAPSAYLGRLENKGSVSSEDLNGYVESHWINHDLLRADGFQDFIIDRAKKLLCAIETVTGRTISGKDSDEVQQAFGSALN
ncbi:GmrSD restriction endonuclease domain-containing protein [Pseudoscardovia suis]|uniref:GmrSD restriction endonuclease domain-containing protein n=1 Tax=Pseudoscardovia suis TaxID=987063 RepID=UPI003F954206